jgi:hypothetical protein
MDADCCEALAHLVELERFDDRDDEFHGSTLGFRGELSLFVRQAFSHRTGPSLGKWHKKPAALSEKHAD